MPPLRALTPSLPVCRPFQALPVPSLTAYKPFTRQQMMFRRLLRVTAPLLAALALGSSKEQEIESKPLVDGESESSPQSPVPGPHEALHVSWVS